MIDLREQVNLYKIKVLIQFFLLLPHLLFVPVILHIEYEVFLKEDVRDVVVAFNYILKIH